MIMEANDHEIANGWPLGLGSMISRFRPPPPLPLPPPQQQLRNNILLRSTSFSSFSSSNLDTESTASFFPDQSVPLGKLIGIRPVEKTNQCCEQRRKSSDERSHSVVPNGQEFGQGLCAPLLQHVIGKKGSCRDSKRQ